MNKLIFLVIIISISVKFSFSQNKINDFTDLKVDDYIELLKANKDIDVNFYIFADPSSCYTCLMSINAYYSTISNLFKANFVLFLNSADSHYSNLIKEEYKWNFEIIPDPINAYKNFFKIKLMPLFIVSDNNGKILFINKCGGTDVSLNQMISLINESKKNKGINEIYSNLTEIKRIKILDDNIQSDNNVSISYCSKYNKYLLLYSNLHKLFIIDSSGKTKKIIDFNKLSNLNTINPFIPKFIYGDSLLLCVDMTVSGDIIYYYLNINNFKVIKLNQLNKILSKDFDIGPDFLFNKINNCLVIIGSPKSKDYIPQESSFLFLTDSKGKLIKLFGKIDSIFYLHNYARIFDAKISSDEYGNIYVIQELTNNIQIFNSDGIYLKDLSCQFGLNWKKMHNELNIKISPSEWVSINSNNSWLYSISCSVDSIISIIYFNTIYPNDTVDPFSNKAEFRYYLYQMNFDGKIIFNDLELPKNTKPIYTDGKSICLLDYSTNIFEIIWFKIKGNNE